ncbi:MAG: hypothetical protein AAFX93_05530 [Verrucomicrobiota bacterium]
MKTVIAILIAIAGVWLGLRYFLPEGVRELAEDLNVPGVQTESFVVLEDLTGRTLKCRIIKVKDKSVEVVRAEDGVEFSIPIDRLADGSRRQIKKWVLGHHSQSTGEVFKPTEEVEDKLYEAAKEHFKVVVVTVDDTDITPQLKRFMKAEDISFSVYDAIKSTGGRRLVEEHGLTHGPVLFIGDEMFIGFTPETVKKVLISEYRREHLGL